MLVPMATVVYCCQGDGTEEVLACSWDGQTYIINLNKDMVRFQFKENVAAFCAGNIQVKYIHVFS